MKFAQALSGKNPFSTAAASGILPDFVKGRTTFLALRVIDHEGHGGAIGPPKLAPVIDEEFRRGYLEAREGRRYSGKPGSASSRTRRPSFSTTKT
jgi:hypothetical protein